MNNANPRSVDLILAIDPGKVKIGIALVKRSGEVIEKLIIRTDDDFRHWLEKLFVSNPPGVIVIGDGTGSERIRNIISELNKNNIPVEIVDETGTTELARKNYFASMPAWKRPIMTIAYILGIGSYDMDADVAVILAKKYLAR